MNAKVIRTMLWAGLLVLLLGRSSADLTVGGADVVPDPPGSAVTLMAGGAGVVPDPPGPMVTMAVAS